MTIGVAVIGAGMAGKAHAAAYRTAPTLYSPTLPDVRCVAIGDINAELGEPARYAGERNPTNEEGGYAGAGELLRRHPEVTAILAANDTMALGVRAALREAGRSVPGDVSLVGYDNSQLARSRFLDLTTVDNRGFDVGVACGEALLRRMGDPGLPAEEVVVPARLVVRSSSGPAPTRA